MGNNDYGKGSVSRRQTMIHGRVGGAQFTGGMLVVLILEVMGHHMKLSTQLNQQLNE